jgi:uncharacterized protein (TIGR00297 family)
VAAAIAVGALTYAFGGWPGLAVLFTFFLTSTALSRLGRARKRAIGDIPKGGPRNALQVLANGGIATACLVAAPHAPLAFVAFAGAYAAANADTWGTELGMLARQTPRSILTGAPLATGLSGGVTLAGTIAEVAGAFVVAAVAAAVVGKAVFLPVLVAGTCGAFADSLFGATLQVRRWCPVCARPCENDPHVCGSATTPRSGLGWITNDGVNFAATATGALLAAALFALAR